MVEGLPPDSVSFRLINLDPLNARRVVVQAAAYGEHGFTEARAGIVESKVEGNRFEVLLAPVSGEWWRSTCICSPINQDSSRCPDRVSIGCYFADGRSLIRRLSI